MLVIMQISCHHWPFEVWLVIMVAMLWVATCCASVHFLFMSWCGCLWQLACFSCEVACWSLCGGILCNTYWLRKYLFMYFVHGYCLGVCCYCCMCCSGCSVCHHASVGVCHGIQGFLSTVVLCCIMHCWQAKNIVEVKHVFIVKGCFVAMAVCVMETTWKRLLPCTKTVYLEPYHYKGNCTPSTAYI